MFTGLVDEVGTIERATPSDAGREFRISCSYEDVADGESIAVNGACLTVRERGPRWFTCAAVTTTLDRTTMASWRSGRRVNLERALRVGDRLGGHLVQGHVDGVGTVASTARRDDALLVDVNMPADLMEFVVLHGSIALDGVSLTVNAVPAPHVVQVSLIEYTLRRTTLSGLLPGHAVHIEADMVGKYVRNLIAPYRKGP